MNDVTHLRQRHVKAMENLERQLRLAEEQRTKEKERLDLAYLRMRECLLQGEPPQKSGINVFLRTLLPFL